MAQDTQAKRWPSCRRTHSVHDTHKEAVRAAHELGFLMNGVPFGYVFAVQQKLGKFAFVSYPRDFA